MFNRLLTLFDRTSYGLLVLAMALMTGLVIAQIFTRYVLDSSIDSADELSRLFFVWSIFLAVPFGVRHGIHVGIDLAVEKLAARPRLLIARIVAALSAILMICVVYSSSVATWDKWDELMPTINATAAVYYIPIIICGVHSLLHLIRQLLSNPLEREMLP